MSAETSPVLLRAEGLTAGYGKMAILHDVTLEVRAGEMVSVIGPNGAVKSTAFKTIVGFLRPTSGRVRFDGQDITGLRPDQVLPRGLAYVPQGRIVFPQMTVLENLEMGAYIERDGTRLTLTVTPEPTKEKAPTGEEVVVGKIQAGIATKAVRFEPYNPVQAVGYGVARTWDMTVLTVKGLWKLVSRQIDSSNIGGPIQIATEAGRQAKEGMGSLALFTAIISVNLAVLNLLPVPMLDGGHLFFFVIEAVIGRPLSVKKREAAQQLGFVLLMLLMVYALWNDLNRIGAFKLFGG